MLYDVEENSARKAEKPFQIAGCPPREWSGHATKRACPLGARSGYAQNVAYPPRVWSGHATKKACPPRFSGGHAAKKYTEGAAHTMPRLQF